MVRAWGLAAVFILLLSTMACLGVLVYFADAGTLREEREQQEMLTRYTARFLANRIETSQRVLQSMGQAMHSDMVETPSEFLQLLQREDSGYAGIFEQLLMTGRSGRMVSYTPAGQDAGISSLQRDALRRTLSDGKPLVVHIPQEDKLHESVQQLVLLITVPLRDGSRGVYGALAGQVRWTQLGLLPQPAEGARGLQIMLVNDQDQLLAHSDPEQQLGHIAQQLQGQGAQWAALSSPETPNVDSQVWDHYLVSRVGMPLPRWQVVSVRDLAPRLLGMQRLSLWQRLGILAMVMVMALGLLVVLWWLSRPLTRLLRQGMQQEPAPPGTSSMLMPALAPGRDAVLPVMAPLSDAQESDEAQHIEQHWQDLEAQLSQALRQADSARAALEQLLAHFPVGVVWLQGNVVAHASRKAAQLLGVDALALQGTNLMDLVQQQPEAMAALQAGHDALVGFGRFAANVGWIQPLTGERCLLHVHSVQLRAPAQGSLWLLRDAGQTQTLMQLPHWQAQYDALTGLPVRASLLSRMQTFTSKALQAPASAGLESPAPSAQALLWLDVDYLEALNAMVGREAGNEVLRQVAWLLQYEQASWGVASRVGSDDFVLWLPQAADPSAVQTLAWRLCEVVQHWTPRFQGKRCAVTVSVGWVHTDAVVAPEALLDAAEVACRDAKRAGQGRAVQGKLSRTVAD